MTDLNKNLNNFLAQIKRYQRALKNAQNKEDEFKEVTLETEIKIDKQGRVSADCYYSDDYCLVQGISDFKYLTIREIQADLDSAADLTPYDTTGYSIGLHESSFYDDDFSPSLELENSKDATLDKPLELFNQHYNFKDSFSIMFSVTYDKISYSMPQKFRHEVLKSQEHTLFFNEIFDALELQGILSEEDQKNFDTITTIKNYCEYLEREGEGSEKIKLLGYKGEIVVFCKNLKSLNKIKKVLLYTVAIENEKMYISEDSRAVFRPKLSSEFADKTVILQNSESLRVNTNEYFKKHLSSLSKLENFELDLTMLLTLGKNIKSEVGDSYTLLFVEDRQNPLIRYKNTPDVTIDDVKKDLNLIFKGDLT